MSVAIDDTPWVSQGAEFSECRRYRYTLWREWLTNKKPWTLLWLLLNPSTADENVLDPTLRRVFRFSADAGASRMEVANVYALRSTNPQALWGADDPVGPDNDRFIVRACTLARIICVGWGSNIREPRFGEVRRILHPFRDKVACLRNSERTGQPWHPLYLPYSSEFQPWPVARKVSE